MKCFRGARAFALARPASVTREARWPFRQRPSKGRPADAHAYPLPNPEREHGVWVVRRKVPPHLQEAVACVLDNGKDRQTVLQKSLGTKDRKEAARLSAEAK